MEVMVYLIYLLKFYLLLLVVLSERAKKKRLLKRPEARTTIIHFRRFGCFQFLFFAKQQDDKQEALLIERLRSIVCR